MAMTGTGNVKDALAMTGNPKSRGWRRILIGILLLLLAAPPVQGEGTGKGPGSPEEHTPKRRVRLALRIAEARNRKSAHRYYQSLARRQKLAPIRIPSPERKEHASGGKDRTGSSQGRR
jgi:hypothetical protein